MTIYITLLRGINVGGNKIIKMAELRALYESLGFKGTQTLLQSGNAVFASDERDIDAVKGRIEAGIVERFGFEVSVIMRTLDALRIVADNHPFTEAQMADTAKMLVMFLPQPPAPDAIAALQAAHEGPEEMHFAGDTLYIYFPDGMGRSKLSTAMIDKKLDMQGTGRNWNTLNKLIALGESLS